MIQLIIILALVCGFSLYFYRQKKAPAAPADGSSLPTAALNKETLATALRTLNCTVGWEKDDKVDVATFDYQGGHFVARLHEASPYISLLYLYTYQTTLGNIEMVRLVCNKCNLSTEGCSLVYTINEEKEQVDVHMVKSLLLPRDMAVEVLKRAFDETFLWQRHFDQGLRSMMGDSNEKGNDDPEKDQAQLMHEFYLLRKQELMHKDGGQETYSTTAGELNLGELLRSMADITGIEPLRLIITRDDQAESLEDGEKILGMPLHSVLIADGQWKWSTGNMTLYYNDIYADKKKRHVSIDFEQLSGTSDALYYRVTLSVIPQVSLPTSSTHEDNRMPRIVSVVLSHDLAPAKPRLDKLNYLYKEAKAKIDAGKTDELTEDERLLTSFDTPDYGYMALQGHRLYSEGRYLEATRMLESLCRATQPLYGRMNKPERASFHNICYYLGASFMQLQQWEKACYYLEMTLSAHQYGYTEMYINCLVNSHDFRAMEEIDAYLEDMEHVMEEEGYDEDSTEWRDLSQFVAFLCRRKAYLLVDSERYEEADELLRKLVKDPESNEFALHELAYVQKKRLETVTDVPS